LWSIMIYPGPGQEAKQIICYSFLPEDGVDRIINLRQRLSKRIRENAEVVGSDEIFFEGDPINIEDLTAVRPFDFENGINSLILIH